MARVLHYRFTDIKKSWRNTLDKTQKEVYNISIKIKQLKIKEKTKMKNYEYENWLESNYLSSDFTDDELDELYKICMKNDDYKNELPF